MNNTLTGLGLALVLALVAALVGPWFVNWTAYRDEFARQASLLVGAPVQLTGAVDARLLPSPYLRFRGLTSGTGAARLTVDEVEFELGVASLLRGELKAERLKLVRPKLGIEVRADGRTRTAFSGAGRSTASPDRVSFDRAEIVDGSVVATTPGKVHFVTRIDGVAEAGSLAGPFKFEGGATVSGERLETRLSTARADEKGAVRLKIAAGPPGAPAMFEADGALTFATKPGFAGKFTVTRAARHAPKAGLTAEEQPDPWRMAGEVKADPGALRLDNLDFAYGADDRAVRLAGRAEATLGEKPRFDVALQSRQVDLDRFAGEGRPKTPAAMLSQMVERFGLASATALDGRLALDLRGLVLAGDVVQDLVVEVESQAGAWRVRKARGRLPGDATVDASGAVTPAGTGAAFVGHVNFATADLAGFRRWLSGGEEQGAAPVRRLAVKGEVTAGRNAVAIEEAELVTGEARSTGRLAWRAAERPGGRARFEAALDADRLDLDALGVDRLLSQALDDRGADVLLAVDAKTLTLAGVKMDGVSLDGALGPDGVDLKRLEVRDAGGAKISGGGRIAPGPVGPEGRIDFRVATARLAPLLALARAAGASERALAALDRRATALAPLALAVSFETGKSGRRIAVSGDGAGGAIDARIAALDFAPDVPAEVEIKVTSDDGRRLATLAGLDLSPVAEASGGALSVRLSGAPSKGMTGEGAFRALGLDVAGRGAMTLGADGEWSAKGDATLKAQDFGQFASAIGRLTPGVAPPLPANLVSKLEVSAKGVRLEAFAGDVAGRPIRGSLLAPSDPKTPIEGHLEFDELPAAALVALAASPEALAPGGGARSAWPSAAFGPSPLRGLSGRFDVKAARLPLGAGQTATDAAFHLAVRPNALAVEKLDAQLAGGRLTGAINLARDQSDATLGVSLQLEQARAERLFGATVEAAPVTGRVALRVEAQGTGRSIAGVVAALAGAGSATLADGAVRRLDVSTIDRIEPKVEAGLALDAPKVANAIERELGGADLKLESGVAPFTLSGGIVRSGEISAESANARLGGVLAFDLRRFLLDADLTLQPNRSEAPQIGLSFEGPLSGPKRRVDATAFTGWLSVRAVERETSRIEAMEADIKERARIARLRAEDERKRVEEEKRRADEERRRVEEDRRKAEAERRKREAEARALVDTVPRPSPSPGLPPALDITPPGAVAPQSRAVTPPTGVFGSQNGRQSERAKPLQPDSLSLPQPILPPPALGGAATR